MEMEKELEQFRQEVERLRAGRQRGSLPYPEVLRAFAVRYLAHALETGGTFAGAAKALGVSEPYPSRRPPDGYDSGAPGLAQGRCEAGPGHPPSSDQNRAMAVARFSA